MHNVFKNVNNHLILAQYQANMHLHAKGITNIKNICENRLLSRTLNVYVERGYCKHASEGGFNI